MIKMVPLIDNFAHLHLVENVTQLVGSVDGLGRNSNGLAASVTECFETMICRGRELSRELQMDQNDPVSVHIDAVENLLGSGNFIRVFESIDASDNPYAAYFQSLFQNITSCFDNSNEEPDVTKIFELFSSLLRNSAVAFQEIRREISNDQQSFFNAWTGSLNEFFPIFQFFLFFRGRESTGRHQIESDTDLIDHTGNAEDRNETGTLSGFVDKIVPSFYSMMCFKMCAKSIDQCLKKSGQLIQHWEQAFSKTYSERVEIDENLKKLCRGNLLQEELGLRGSSKVTGLNCRGQVAVSVKYCFSTFLKKPSCKKCAF